MAERIVLLGCLSAVCSFEHTTASSPFDKIGTSTFPPASRDDTAMTREARGPRGSGRGARGYGARGRGRIRGGGHEGGVSRYPGERRAAAATWERDIVTEGGSLRAILDTGCRGWSVLTAEGAERVGATLRPLQQPVAVSGPLAGHDNYATHYAVLDVKVAGAITTITAIVVAGMDDEYELYVSDTDMDLLYVISVAERPALEPGLRAEQNTQGGGLDGSRVGNSLSPGADWTVSSGSSLATGASSCPSLGADWTASGSSPATKVCSGSSLGADRTASGSLLATMTGPLVRAAAAVRSSLGIGPSVMVTPRPAWSVPDRTAGIEPGPSLVPTLVEGLAGPKRGTFFTAANTRDYDKHLASLLATFAPQVTESRTFVNTARDPVVLPVRADHVGPLPWARVRRSYPQSHELLLKEWVAKGLKRGSLSRWLPPPSAPWDKPPGQSSLANVFIAEGRVVVNMVAINKVVDGASFSMDEPLRLYALVQAIASGRVLGKIDLRSAYDQCAVHQTEGLGVYVEVLGATYRVNSLPQGLALAPFIFNSIVMHLLEGIPGVHTYFDDVGIVGPADVGDDGLMDVSQYVASFTEVMRRLNDTFGFTVNIEKSVVFADTVDMGGWAVGGGEIHVTSDWAAQLAALELPRTGAELRAFLGLMNYMTHIAPGAGAALAFAHSLSSTSGRLSALPPNTLAMLHESLNSGLSLIREARGLATPDWALPFTLSTDASRRGVGGVLTQERHDGTVATVAFCSRGLVLGEKHYSAAQMELLAVVVALRRFEYYLLGRRFRLRTDSRAIVGAMGKLSPADIVLRWWETIQAFTFDVEHIRGVDNVIPDGLSRLSFASDSAKWEDEIVRQYRDAPGVLTLGSLSWVKELSPVIDQPRSTSGPVRVAAVRTRGRVTVGADMPTPEPPASSAHPLSARAVPFTPSAPTEGAARAEITQPRGERQRCEGHRYPSGLWVSPRDDWLRIPRWDFSQAYVEAPLAARAGIVEKAHALGHSGAAAMVTLIHRDGWDWTGIKEDANACVQACTACARHRVAQQGFHPVLASNYDTLEPGLHWVLDTVTMPVSASDPQLCAALIVTDVATRRVWTAALRGKSGVEVGTALAKIALTDGVPAIISSDNGSEFVNATVAQMAKIMKVDYRLSAEYHPQGNGISEAAVKRVSERLRRMLDSNLGQWDDYLPAATYAVNMTVSDLTGSVPLELYLGRAVRGLNDYATELKGSKPRLEPSPAELAKRAAEARHLLDVVTEGLGDRARAKAEERRLRQLATQKVIVGFTPGQLVFIREPIKGGKLQSRNSGPFTIVSRSQGGAYTMVDAAGEEYPNRVAPNRLMPFGGVSFDPAASYEVEKVLDFRVGPQRDDEYLVQWKGYTELTWTRGALFNDKACIADYWTSTTAAARAAFEKVVSVEVDRTRPRGKSTGHRAKRAV